MKLAARNVLTVLLTVVAVVVCLTTTPANAQPTRPTTVATMGAADASRVYMAASAKDYWVAITKATGQQDAPYASVVYNRQHGADKFSVIARLPGRVSSLSQWAHSAVVLLEDGQWLTVWNGGSSGGVALPARGQLLALAGDDQTLWAIGAVEGGADAVRAATRSSTRPATTTTTGKPAALVPVLFKLEGHGWVPVLTVPVGDALLAPGSISLAVTGDRVAMALATSSGQPAILSAGFDGSISNDLAIDSQATAQVFSGPNGEALAWLHTGDGKDVIFRIDPKHPGLFAEVAPSVIPRNANAAMGTAFGYLRVLVAGNDVLEQRLAPDGKPVGEPSPITTLPPPDEAPPWMNYAQGGVLALLGLAIFSSLRYRDAVRETLARRDRPRPARIWIRLAAAIVDAIPMIIGFGIAYARSKPGEFTSFSLASTLPELLGIGVYLLHTTVSELIFRRTLGKAIFGLKVVNLTGERPTVGAILIRNVLRVIDIALLVPFLLPILLLLFSPLRQRAGDAAAGTIVIDLSAPKMTDEAPEDRED